MAVLVLLVHMLLSGDRAARAGSVALLGWADSRMIARLVTLSLLVLLVQDVLGRVVAMRWLLTGLGASVAVGAVLRLYILPVAPVAPRCRQRRLRNLLTPEIQREPRPGSRQPMPLPNRWTGTTSLDPGFPG